MAMQIVVPGLLPGAIDSTARVPVGTESQDEHGNTYKYLSGVASTVEGTVVTYHPGTFATTVSGAASTGFLAIATAATVAATFGWYLVEGQGTAVASGAIAANVLLNVAASGAVNGAAPAAATVITNAKSAAANVGATVLVEVRRPFVVGV